MERRFPPDDDPLTGRWEVFRDQPDHGWVPWHGGEAPSTEGSVDVRLRSGRIIRYRSPDGIGGRKNPGGNWVHLGEGGDIVAWRRHVEPAWPGDPDAPIPF